MIYFREDMYAQDSIDLLTNSGIQFKKHEDDGIDVMDFAELLMTSGIILTDNIKWLSFHRYDLNLALTFNFRSIALMVSGQLDYNSKNQISFASPIIPPVS